MNAKQLWQATLDELQGQLSRGNFVAWVKNVTAVSFERDSEADGRRVLVLSTPSTFAKEWLDTRLLPQIVTTVQGIVGEAVDVRVVVGQPRRAASPTAGEADGPDSHLPVSRTSTVNGATTDGDAVPDTGTSGVTPSGRSPSRRSAKDTSSATSQSSAGQDGWQPNPRYTFGTFVVGASNNLAHAAALSVAAAPGRSYNPLFIYGGVGLGKTHLLHAIAHEALAKGLTVRYASTEQFTNDLINAIREHRTEEFRSRYRAMDVLLVDDIQFIAGKESTQEEFFHTFNALHEASRQVVISSDRPPKSIPTLEARLRSRFEWGLIADVQPPDLETRIAILVAKAREQREKVSQDVLEFLAQRIQSNIRELEGALNRVIAFVRLTGRPLNVDTAASAIADLLSPVQRRYLGPQQILEAVARYYHVEPTALRGKARDKEIVLPRQVAMYLMREETEASLIEIGRELGRDHSTVLHGYTKIQTEIEANSQLRREVLSIKELLYESARP